MMKIICAQIYLMKENVCADMYINFIDHTYKYIIRNVTLTRVTLRVLNKTNLKQFNFKKYIQKVL